MSQQLLSETPEKTQQRVEHRETEPGIAPSFQGNFQPLHQLQRTLGNRQVAKLIQSKRLTSDGKVKGLQRKLTVGASDDEYEQEADRVARQVMAMPDADAVASQPQNTLFSGQQNPPLQAKPLAASITPFVQRQPEQEHESEDKDGEEDQEPPIQAKLFSEPPDYHLQRELSTEQDDSELVQAKAGGPLSGSFEAGNAIETQLSLSKGRGSPLPDSVRSYMEPRFGVDFNHVRVHTGNDAIQMNQDVGAQAFTHGSDIYFGEGRSPNNLELTAHELTHVVQQTGSLLLQTKKRGEEVVQSGSKSSEKMGSDIISSINPTRPTSDRRVAEGEAPEPATLGRTSKMVATGGENERKAEVSDDGATRTEPEVTIPDIEPMVKEGVALESTAQSQLPELGETAMPETKNKTTATQTQENINTTAETTTTVSENVNPEETAPEPETQRGAAEVVNTDGGGGASVAPSVSGTMPPVSAASNTAPEFAVDSSGLSSEYTALIHELALQHRLLLVNAEQQKTQIIVAAEQQKQNIQHIAEAEAARIESAYDGVVASIQGVAENQRGGIYSALEVERAKINATAEAEITRLNVAIVAKKTAVLDKGNEKAERANQLGDEEAQRAQQGSNERAQRVAQIGEQKAAQYSRGEKGAEIASNIRNEVPKLVGQFVQIGNDVAGTVREKATEIAGHFREEAAEIVAKFDEPQSDAQQQILENRDKTLETLQKMAEDAASQIGNQANDLVTKLNADKAEKVAQVRDSLPAINATLDQGVTDALAKIDVQTTSTADELNTFAEKLTEGAWYPPFVQDARADVLAALSAQQSEQQNFVTQVIDGFTQATSTAQDEVTGQSQTIIDAVKQIGNDFQTNACKIADDTKNNMQQASGKGEESMKAVTSEVENKLQEAVDKCEVEWQKQLSEMFLNSIIPERVNGALSDEDRAVNQFAADIDRRATQAASAGILESVWDFVVGIFEGLLLGAWEMLKAVWNAVKTPLFWIVVAVVVVVLVIAVVILVIKGAAVLAAIAAVLAFAGKVLLVIGVIAGLIAAGYYLYLMITQPNLSWRERGQMLGRAVFEVIMAFVGTGILKRLGVFAQLGRLSHFVKRVGGLWRAIRLINKLPDLEKLIVLLDKVGDADKLIILLDKVGDAEKLILLLDKVGDAGKLIELLDKVGDAEKLIRLLNSVQDVAQLERLLGNAKLADVIQLERLLSNTKLTDAAQLERLLADAKLTDAAQLERLLGNAKVADAARLERLLGNAKLTDVAQLERLLGNAKLTDVAQLERLLGNAKLVDAVQLERLVGNAKLTDVAQLERLLVNATLTDATQLERLLSHARVTDATQLESMLNHLGDATDLERFLAVGNRIWEGQAAAAKAEAHQAATYAAANGGAAQPGYAGNRPYGNNGHTVNDMILPRKDAAGNPITYREYDIHPHTPGVNRGPERIVIGSDGRTYYTGDHYRSFTLF